jgi:hypothetical protein
MALDDLGGRRWSWRFHEFFRARQRICPKQE